MLGLGLALISSLSWGTSDFLGGLQSRRMALLRVMVLSQGFALTVVLVVLVARGNGPPAARIADRAGRPRPAPRHGA